MKRSLLSFVPVLGLSLFAQCAIAADPIEVKFPKAPKHTQNVFDRMFPELDSFAKQSDTVRETTKALGAKGGLMDAMDNLTDPIQSIINQPVFSPNNPDNPNMTAGFTFIGQFLDHDITLDKKSELLVRTKPKDVVNFRTPAFDLDSVYGDGPTGSPELYETSSGLIKFIVQVIPGSAAVSRHNAVRYDLPRDSNGNAIIAESRNDENIIISQFHLAMLKFHNAVTDYLAAQPAYVGATPQKIFDDAQKTVRWHYQWIIVNEFLPTTIGQDRVTDIMTNGLKFYKPFERKNQFITADGRVMPFIPVEFTVAAYRFGHSQVRPSYRVNFGPTGGSPFFAFVFDDALDANAADPADMRGGKPAPRRFVDWQTFFNFGDGNFRPNKRIDTKISSPLMFLLGKKGASPGMPNDGEQSLASRNLMRHVNFGLPSGQDVAYFMGVPALTRAQLSDLAAYPLDHNTAMDTSTPLWFYILKEAEVMENGLRMGPVGGRIVGEVFVGLLKADSSSYVAAQPSWTPTLPSATPGTFRIVDLLNFAGVVPPL